MKKTFIYILIIYMFSWNNVLRSQNNMPNHLQRIYSLSTIWKEMQYNFAFPEKLKQANIDSLYLAYLPKVEGINSEYEYYKTLSEFIAHFNEAHTRIYIAKRPDDTPPIKISNLGKKIIVSDISKKSVEKIPIGSEILKINNIPVIEYINDSVSPYISASTPHWKFEKSATEVLYGRPHTSVNILVKPPKGKEHEVTLIRDYNSNGMKEPMVKGDNASPISIKIIEKNIGYIQLGSFGGQFLDSINNTLRVYLPQLRNCKGLIIDIRGNRGGTDAAWENIACSLIPESQFKLSGKWLSRKNITTFRKWGEYAPQFRSYYEGTAMEEIKHPSYLNEIDDSLKLSQPLVILSGQYVGSAAEDFLILMKEQKRGIIIGEPSVGCVGEPMFIPLTNNYELMFCSKKYINVDGSQPNDTGILPDIEVRNSYESYYIQGIDNILDRGIQELMKTIK